MKEKNRFIGPLFVPEKKVIAILKNNFILTLSRALFRLSLFI